MRRRLLERLPSASAKHSVRCIDHCKMPHVAAYGILAVQALFFFLGGIRDNFMTGKVIMPDAVHKSIGAARFPPLLIS